MLCNYKCYHDNANFSNFISMYHLMNFDHETIDFNQTRTLVQVGIKKKKSVMWKFLNDPNLFTVGIKIGAGVKKLASCNPLETSAVNPTNHGGLLRFRLIGCLRPPPTIFRPIARSTAFCFCPTTSFRWTLLSRTSWLFRSPAIIRVNVLGSDQSYGFLDDDRQKSIDARFHCNRRRLIQIQVSSYDFFSKCSFAVTRAIYCYKLLTFLPSSKIEVFRCGPKAIVGKKKL